MFELSTVERRWGRRLAVIAAAAFVAGAVGSLLLALNVITRAAEPVAGAELPDRILTVLQNEADRFPQELATWLFLGLSFLALAGVGQVLRRALDPSGVRGAMVAGLFLIAAGVGLVAALAFIGGQAVAADATYCDCKYATEQIIARGGVLDLVGSIQSWLVNGAVALFGVAVLLVADAASDMAVAPGWTRLGGWLGALLLLDAVFSLGFPPLAQALRLDVDTDLVTGVPSLVVLMVLVPWWLLWFRRLLGRAAAAA